MRDNARFTIAQEKFTGNRNRIMFTITLGEILELMSILKKRTRKTKWNKEWNKLSEFFSFSFFNFSNINTLVPYNE